MGMCGCFGGFFNWFCLFGFFCLVGFLFFSHVCFVEIYISLSMLLNDNLLIAVGTIFLQRVKQLW